jgi:hypothetical protein
VALTAATMALLTPLLLVSVTGIVELVERRPLPPDVSGTMELALFYVYASPGAALLGGALCVYLRRRRLTWRHRLFQGTLLGIAAGWLNVTLTWIVLAIFAPQLFGLWGTPPPLVDRLLRALKTTISFGAMRGYAHLFIPAGALLGFWVGAMAHWGLPRDVTAPAPPRPGSARP